MLKLNLSLRARRVIYDKIIINHPRETSTEKSHSTKTLINQFGREACGVKKCASKDEHQMKQTKSRA